MQPRPESTSAAACTLRAAAASSSSTAASQRPKRKRNVPAQSPRDAVPAAQDAELELPQRDEEEEEEEGRHDDLKNPVAAEDERHSDGDKDEFPEIDALSSADEDDEDDEDGELDSNLNDNVEGVDTEDTDEYDEYDEEGKYLTYDQQSRLLGPPFPCSRSRPATLLA